uniref:Putative secreted peptide n=1 Tax=Anopheles braziliensis TaxID=58242 RepID=A0A2M3ZSF4_9DIPT
MSSSITLSGLGSVAVATAAGTDDTASSISSSPAVCSATGAGVVTSETSAHATEADSSITPPTTSVVVVVAVVPVGSVKIGTAASVVSVGTEDSVSSLFRANCCC